MYQRTRGASLTISIIPTLARLEEIPSDMPQINGKLNLRELIGESTQELRGLENVAATSILHPEELFRRVNRDGLLLCSQRMVKDVYVEDEKVYLILQDEGYPAKHAYVCDVPKKYKGNTAHSFLNIHSKP